MVRLLGYYKYLSPWLDYRDIINIYFMGSITGILINIYLTRQINYRDIIINIYLPAQHFQEEIIFFRSLQPGPKSDQLES